jgi:hypothetical protein
MRADLPSLKEAARVLGGEVVAGGNILCPGPGHSANDRSLSVKPSHNAPDGFTVKSFCDDDFRDCRDHVREKLGLAPWQPGNGGSGATSVTVPRRRPRVPTADNDDPGTTTVAIQTWVVSIPAKGTAVEEYLRSRGLPWREEYGDAIRFHPALRLGERLLWAMVALLRDIITNEPCGIHRTYLDDEARKVDRRMLGRSKGAAIKLDAHEEVTLGLHIGEGIETTMAGREFGFAPAWAVGSSGGVADFPVIAGLEALTLLHDNDNASEKAIEKVRERYENAGCEVHIRQPEHGDMNDALAAFKRRAS